MNIKPILFNTDMVRAILDGRKTVTRRLIKQNVDAVLSSPFHEKYPEMPDAQIITKLCMPPYQLGDILYVRETFAQVAKHIFWYRADNAEYTKGILWKPSIHMPKEAARIFLKVKDVRVERLQEITDEQAEKEGCSDYTSTALGFCYLWDSTIRKSDLDYYGWAADPWVWVIEFERCEQPSEWL